MPISAIPADTGYMGDPRRGASLGRPSTAPTDRIEPRKFYLVRVRLNSGGYDSGGAYWGVGMPLYRYESEDGEASGYLRGRTRDQAKEAVRAKHPKAAFFA